MSRTRALMLALTTIGCMACPPATSADVGSVEYQVKAAFLSKFGNFVMWPAETGDIKADHATLCIVGNDPFGTVIDQAVQGHRLGDRDLVVRRIEAGTSADGCQILYVGGNSAEAAETLRALRGKPVLTVSDSRGTRGASPVINFVIRNNNVRFEIDEGAAADNGLVISSQLLALAVSVKANKQE